MGLSAKLLPGAVSAVVLLPMGMEKSYMHQQPPCVYGYLVIVLVNIQILSSPNFAVYRGLTGHCGQGLQSRPCW